MSGEKDVFLGLPQCTVLAAILFVIMISDIDENVKRSIVRSFADDTRTNKKINNPNDRNARRFGYYLRMGNKEQNGIQ